MERQTIHFFVQNIILIVSVLMIIWLPSLCFCQESRYTNISINILSLRDPDTISSYGQVFQLGFFSPPNNTNRYLAIYYTFSPDTIIWIPNREQPLNDSSGHFSIASDGNLVLTNRWNETVWSTNINSTSLRNNTSAQLLDTGNLLLKDTSTGTVLWESFSQPLNVFVPTMKITYDTNTHKQVLLTSWKSVSDPAVGNFTAGIEAMRSTIPQSVYSENDRPYWRSGPWNGHIFSGIEVMYSPFLQEPREQGGVRPSLDPQGGGIPVLYNENGTFNFVFPQGMMFTRSVLNLSGAFVGSFWNNQLRDWQFLTVNPREECDRYGTCGPFGICNRSNSPICSCLTGFVPSNQDEWNNGNWAGGCVRRRQLQCSLNNYSGGTEDRFFRQPYTKVPDFPEQVPLIQPTQCMERCLGNCSCIGYAHDPYIGCMVWHDYLIDVMAMDRVGIDLYIRLHASELDNLQERRLVIIIPTVCVFAVICVIISIVWFQIVKRKGCEEKDKDRGQSIPTNSATIVLKDDTDNVNIAELSLFTFETLANATNQFGDSNLLGVGGFGHVYKGILQNGKEVAIKRLSVASRQGNKEFMNEMAVISKLQHKNLVTLIGCCAEREEKMLIYEYMPNKSLDRCLFDTTHVSRKILDWKRRSSIIAGIGRGLLYLHNDSRLTIIHRDLKPSNVLLDDDWNPKISDFGMARIFGREEGQCNTTRVVGTYGYMAPEYAMDGQYSEKSDIYSFGVLMLEILSGKKNTCYYNQELSLGLLGYAWKMWHANNGLTFVDEAISISSIHGDIMRCINIALLCVQEFPNDRPSIDTVLSMLNKEIIDLPMPSEPAFPGNSQIGMTHTLSQLEQSLNELTITTIHGR